MGKGFFPSLNKIDILLQMKLSVIIVTSLILESVLAYQYLCVHELKFSIYLFKIYKASVSWTQKRNSSIRIAYPLGWQWIFLWSCNIVRLCVWRKQTRAHPCWNASSITNRVVFHSWNLASSIFTIRLQHANTFYCQVGIKKARA